MITGGSSGLGEAAARRLTADGAVVVVAARRMDRLNALVNEITASGGRARAMPVDVTKRGDVEAMIAGTVETFGRVDVLVNNAGLMV